jgi:chromosome segregation ATPase
VLNLIWLRKSPNPMACDDSLDKHDAAQRADLFRVSNELCGLKTVLGCQNGTVQDAIASVEAKDAYITELGERCKSLDAGALPRRQRIAQLESEVQRITEALASAVGSSEDRLRQIRAIGKELAEAKTAYQGLFDSLEIVGEERDELRGELNSLNAELNAQAETIRALRARLQGAEKDTRRLDWIQGKSDLCRVDNDAGISLSWNQRTLREAIDAAMGEKEGK